MPIDFGGMKASGIAAIAYDRLKRPMGVSTPTQVLDPRFMIAVVEEEILQNGSMRTSSRRPFRDRLRRAAGAGVDAPDAATTARACYFPRARRYGRTPTGLVLLNPDGSPPPSACRAAATTSTTSHSTAGRRIDPAKFRPSPTFRTSRCG